MTKHLKELDDNKNIQNIKKSGVKEWDDDIFDKKNLNS